MRAAGQINVPGKIDRIIFAVALISPSELGGAADLIPRLGVCKNSAVVIEQHPHMRQPFPGQHKLYPGGIVIDLRVVRDAAFDLQALPIQLEGRLQRCLRMDIITQAAESASKKEQRKGEHPLLLSQQHKQTKKRERGGKPEQTGQRQQIIGSKDDRGKGEQKDRQLAQTSLTTLSKTAEGLGSLRLRCFYRIFSDSFTPPMR